MNKRNIEETREAYVKGIEQNLFFCPVCGNRKILVDVDGDEKTYKVFCALCGNMTKQNFKGETNE